MTYVTEQSEEIVPAFANKSTRTSQVGYEMAAIKTEGDSEPGSKNRTRNKPEARSPHQT